MKRYQSKYLQAKKRDKPEVASLIVETIRRKGGRFLRRQSSRFDTGMVTWIDIGDARAREKTCQALREGAPEIRKKRKASSSEDGGVMADDRETEVQQRNGSFDTLRDSGPKCSSLSGDTTSPDLAHHNEETPIMVRPSFELLTKHSFVRAISVDELEPHDRALYLRDFLPPDPAMSPRADSRPIRFQRNVDHSDEDLYSRPFVEV